jgi:hypothetical protein
MAARKGRKLEARVIIRSIEAKNGMLGAVWRFGQGLVSRDGRAIREKIETEPKVRKWLPGSHQAKSKSKMDPLTPGRRAGHFGGLLPSRHQSSEINFDEIAGCY